MVALGRQVRISGGFTASKGRVTRKVLERGHISTATAIWYTAYTLLCISRAKYMWHLTSQRVLADLHLYISIFSFYLSFGIRPCRPLMLRCKGKEVRNDKQKVPTGRKIRCRISKA
jgi:hypothetical protein